MIYKNRKDAGKRLAEKISRYAGRADAVVLGLARGGIPVATGASMRAAVKALCEHDSKSIVVAVPTAAEETCTYLEGMVDELICAEMPSPFYAVGAWYKDFPQTTDDEVRDLLKRAQAI